MKQLDKEIQCTKCPKKFCTKNDLIRHEKSKHDKGAHVKCKSCEKEFLKNSDLELHLEKEHKIPKTFKCDRCDMDFMLKWRLEKHSSVHQENFGKIRFCHYFNNSKHCPFVKLGCMFKHQDAPQCKFLDRCSKNLCQFKHARGNEKEEMIDVNEENNVDISVQEEIEMTEEEKRFEVNVNENFLDMFENFLEHKRTIQCYNCSYRAKSKILSNIKYEVSKHLRIEHREVIDTFENGELVIENLIHAEFIEFFATD